MTYSFADLVAGNHTHRCLIEAKSVRHVVVSHVPRECEFGLELGAKSALRALTWINDVTRGTSSYARDNEVWFGRNQMIKNVVIGAILATATLVNFGHDAHAQEGDFQGKKAGDLLVRLRAIAVVPDENDSTVTVIGGNINASDVVVPELDFTYFITDHIAAELILATSPHNISASGTTLGDVDIGDVWLLPPTLTLQYHPFPASRFSPYVGAGVNATLFYAEDAAGGTVTDLSFDDLSFGFAAQVGLDYQFNNNWSVNLDLKKVFIEADASLNFGTIQGDVDLDPWIFGIGVGYKF